MNWAAVALVLFLGTGLGRANAAEAPPLVAPAEVVREMQAARGTDLRLGLSTPDLSLLVAAPRDPEPEPPAEWRYRNPVTGPLARAVGGPEGRFQSGMHLLGNGDLDGAAEAFAAVLASGGDSNRGGDAAFWLAEIRRQQSRPDDAIAFLRRVTGVRAREAAFRLGWFLNARGRVSEALDLWARLAADAQSPWRIRAAVARGASLLAQGRLEEARRALEPAASGGAGGTGAEESARFAALLPLAVSLQLLEERLPAQRLLLDLLLKRPDHPATPEAGLALGWVLLADGNVREALRRFVWGLEVARSGLAADRARFGALLCHLDLEEPDRAVEAFAALGGREPWAARARLALSWFHLQRRDGASALRWIEAPSGAEIASPALSAYLAAESLRLVGRVEEAGARYEAVGDGPLRAPALHGKALTLLSVGDRQGAAVLLERLSTDRPDYSEIDRVRVVLASALHSLGRGDAARRFAEAVSDRSPAFADALLLRAELSSRQGRWVEAASLLGRFAARFPGDPNWEKAALDRARAEFRRGAPEAALAALATLEARPLAQGMQTQIRVERGRVLAALGRTTEARPLLEEGLASVQREVGAAAREALGGLDEKSGHFAEALAHFDASLALSPEGDVNRDARAGRARCLYQLNRTEEALQDFTSLGRSLDALYGRALCLARLGPLAALEEAVEAFSEVTRPDPDERSAELTALVGEARLVAGKALLATDPPTGLPLLETVAASPLAAGLRALQALASYREEKGTDAEALAAWDALARRTEGELKSGALRAAARRAERLGDRPAARERLTRALAACPKSNVAERQALLADLGELELRTGRPGASADALRDAGGAGLGPDGLRALRTLAVVQEELGQKEEALETRLRIGYVYGLDRPGVAETVVQAAASLEARQRPARARALYQRVARETSGEWAERARSALARLAARDAGVSEPSPPAPPRPPP